MAIVNQGNKMSDVPAHLALAARLRIALVRVMRRQRRERSSVAITDAQYGFLSALDRLGPMTPTALAESEGVQKPFATRTLAALVDAGLAARAVDPIDGRQRIFTITPAGQSEVSTTRHLRDEFMAAWITELTDSERATLVEACALFEDLASR